jgi:hypothetical protein
VGRPVRLRRWKYPTVNTIHVAIDGIRSEHSHTPPTNMRVALRASHMVATPVLLDHDFAPWALLDVAVTLSPTIQHLPLGLRIPLYLPLLTAEPVVVFPTGHANRHETRSALENPAPRIGFEGVDFGAVGSGAVLNLSGLRSRWSRNETSNRRLNWTGARNRCMTGRGIGRPQFPSSPIHDKGNRLVSEAVRRKWRRQP